MPLYFTYKMLITNLGDKPYTYIITMQQFIMAIISNICWRIYMKKKIISMALALTAMASWASASDYTLRPGDQLNIIVTQDTDISSSIQSATTSPYLVRPDGKVSFPLVGEIDANGMTVSEFPDTLHKGLSKYYVDPDVAVNIVQLGTVRVFVFGEVKKPGAYELTKGHTIIDAIGAAEGFTWDTAKKKIFLIHQDDTNKAIPINLNNMLKTGNMKDNVELKEGDILYLTKNGRINFVRDIAPLFSAAYMISEIKDNN